MKLNSISLFNTTQNNTNSTHSRSFNQNKNSINLTKTMNLNTNPIANLNKATMISFGNKKVWNEAKAIEALEEAGMSTKKDKKDGMLVLYTHNLPFSNIQFKEFEVDPNDLFKHVKKLEGDADFEDSEVTSLGNTKVIEGHTSFENSKVTDLSSLETIFGDAVFENSQITSLGKLKTIEHDAFFTNSKITNLGSLERIGGFANFDNSRVNSLGALREISEGYTCYENQQALISKLKERGLKPFC